MAISSGDFITITKRKCSDKIQPNIKVGGIYAVLETDTLKDGTKVLVLVRDGRKKTTTRCNANRFEWRRYKPEELAERLTKMKVEQFNQKIEDNCTSQENAAISIKPILILILMWNYADKVLDYCSQNKLSEFKKASRALRELRKQVYDHLDEHLERERVTRFENFIKDFKREYAYDFRILQLSMENELFKQNKGITHSEMRTYAYIGIMMCYTLYRYELRSMKLIDEKASGYCSSYHLPYRKEFFLAMTCFLEGLSYDSSDHEILCLKIFEKNFDSIEFEKE